MRHAYYSQLLKLTFTVWWYYYVPWSFRPYAEGDHHSCSFFHEGQDHRSPRAQVLRLDRWFHSCFSVHLPANVDLQAGVRRERPLNRPPQVLLRFVLSCAPHRCFEKATNRRQLCRVKDESPTPGTKLAETAEAATEAKSPGLHDGCERVSYLWKVFARVKGVCIGYTRERCNSSCVLAK